MRKLHLYWLLGVAVVAAMLFAAACSSDDEDNGGDPTDVPSATEPEGGGDTTGVTDTEVVLGTHTPLSGAVAVYSQIANSTKAYLDYINATEGGVHGRQITYLLEDDQYSPSLTVDLVRKLVEQDEVFAIVNGLGTATHLQVLDYLEERGIPDMYVATGATEWVKDPAANPTVFGSIANYVGEGIALGRYIAETYPGQKVGFILQNDDFGADGADGLKRGIGDALEVVGEERYEVTDPNLNAQVDALQAAGADVIAAWATPLVLSTAIKHARLDLGWDVPFVHSGVSNNELTIALVGDAEIEGTVTQTAIVQAYDTDNPAVAEHLAIMQEYAGTDAINALTIYGQFIGELIVETLRLAGEDLTREGFVAAAESITDFTCSLCLFPVNMSDTDHDAAQAIVLLRAEGGRWVPFGEGISWEGVLPGDMTVDDLESIPLP